MSATPRPGLLLLLVAFGNAEEVNDFISHVRATCQAPISFAVCDNTPGGSGPITSDADCIVTARPDNPGYLEGALHALRAFQSQRPTPEWIAITNTDLTFRRGDLLTVLSRYDSDVPVVIGPRITEGVDAQEMNPHVVTPRGLGRLRLNHWTTATPVLAYGYLGLHGAKFAVTRSRRTRTGASSPDPRHLTPSDMFSPYGAMMFFSRAFMTHVGLPPKVPLFAEEYAVAETARRAGARVRYEPDIHVNHDSNSTTGPRLSWRRAKALTVAFRYIYDFARTP